MTNGVGTTFLFFSIYLSGCAGTTITNNKPIMHTNTSVHALAVNNTVKLNKNNDHGVFLGRIKTEWLDDNGRTMKLLTDLKFKDSKGKIWLAPRNSIVDGASIPEMLWSFIGSPFSGRYRNASVVHDIACKEKKEPWEAVHSMFYDGMMTSGVPPLKAKIMYAAVRHLGPRWNTKKRIIGAGFTTKYVVSSAKKSTLSREDINRLIKNIKTLENSGKSMSLKQIENFK